MENYEIKRFLKEQIILAIMLVIVYFVMFYAFPASCRYFASLFNRIYDISSETSSFRSLQEALQLFFSFAYKTLIYFALFVFFAIKEGVMQTTMIGFIVLASAAYFLYFKIYRSKDRY